jgi:Arrestin (or S-antigen), C-terminal domain/Arrestin (or S-antigen), N-terminal domain
VHYEGKELYLNSRTYLFGQHGGETLEISPGLHKYDFACHLPELLPGSFAGIHGQIEYYVEAVVDVPWGFDKETKVPFAVVRQDNFSMYPEFRVPMKQEDMKKFCCLFCESDVLFVSASIQCGAFITGQSIPVKIEYMNKSDIRVNSTQLKLRRKINFVSHTPETKVRTVKEMIAECSAPGIGPTGEIDFVAELPIPSVLPTSNDRYCRVIQVTYELVVIADTDGLCHNNVEFDFPIALGNVSTQPGELMPSSSSGYPSVIPSAPVDTKDNFDDLRNYYFFDISIHNIHFLV